MQSVKFPARFEFLDEIRAFVGGIAREAGFNDKDIYSIQLAADEAATNVIEHAYQGNPNGEIEIHCGIRNETITVVLLDHGKPFDPSTVQQPNLKVDIAERQVGGLGIYLMRTLMDDVRYETGEGRGNRLTLTKHK
jgi:serine/threonine-protein kinase RsbW